MPKKNGNSPSPGGSPKITKLHKNVDTTPQSPVGSPKITQKIKPKYNSNKYKSKVEDDIIPHQGKGGPQGEHFLKDLFVKFVVLGAAIAVVQIAPVPQVDVQKTASSSFLSLYIGGKLDNVAFITQMLIAAVASIVFDIGVVYYHLTNPPHPKFVMLLLRKLCIYTHLISGITEIVTGITAFVVTDQTTQQIAAMVMAVASITHSLTAYYQTTLVFGAKGIMTPGYLYAITLHISFAFRLFHKPTSVLYLLVTFLMLHIYVWCRFFVFFFRLFSIFTGYHYTVAITLSGSLLFPYAIGPLGNYVFLVICSLYCILEAILSDKTGKDLARKLFAEHERYALLTSDSVNNWKDHLTQKAGVDNDERMARDVFASYDTDNTGKLGVNEVQQIVKSLGVHDHTVAKIMDLADISHDGFLSFEEFYRFVWNIGSMKQRLTKKPASQAPASERDQAKLVFDMLDSDKSGYIELAELEMLLTQWGMPEGEANSVLTKYEKKKITFDSFFKNFKPVWSFAILYVFEG